MKQFLLVILTLCVFSYADAQDFNQFKALPDSAYLNMPEYQQGNKYQRDAILFVDMLADTHPYYVTKIRQQILMDKRTDLLNNCGACQSDTAFTSLLQGVLGKLCDKHTDVIDTLTFINKKNAVQSKQDETVSSVGSHLMSKHDVLFDYTMFKDESICYMQFNQCADARTQRNATLPRFDTFLEEMFKAIDSLQIKTLVVDAQYNNGGSSMLCDELLSYLYPLGQLKEYRTFIRFSNLMASYNPRIGVAKQKWEADGHAEELYSMPNGNMPELDRKIFDGHVVFVQGPKTFSSAGMLMTLVRDNGIGPIIGSTSTYSPSHYGEVLPYRLPNTGVIGSISCKYFERPDSTCADDETLEPTQAIDTNDKEALWNYIVSTYGKTVE